MRIARKLLIAAALLSWPWIASAPQAAPAAAPAGIGFRAAPGLLRLVGDHDRDRDRNRHHQRRPHHRRHRRNGERREHEH